MYIITIYKAFFDAKTATISYKDLVMFSNIGLIILARLRYFRNAYDRTGDLVFKSDQRKLSTDIDKSYFINIFISD